MTPQTSPQPSLGRLAALSAFLLSMLLLSSAAPAQEADALFRDFEPFGDLEVTLDGKALEGSALYSAQRAGAYLVEAPSLETVVLINVRTKGVEGIAKDKVRHNDNGTVDVLFDAEFDSLGTFTVSGDQVVAALPTGELKLSPKPSLLGLQSADDMVAHNPSYGFKAERYPPTATVIERLKKETRNVTARVYFGSWCPTCSRLVPGVIKVDRALEGSKIQFEYYGLPKTMDDPSAQAMNVHSVPTVVVMSEGKEIGRLDAGELGVPEKALDGLLNGGP